MLKSKETSGKVMAKVPCMLGKELALDLGWTQSVTGWMWKVREGQASMSTVTPEWMEVGLLGWAAWAGGRAG